MQGRQGVASHQTVRLARGRHASASEGACVLELVSMLAGEEFSDSPRCVSPVIASFLRVYNDVVDDGRRQDLYAYATAAVNTCSGRRSEATRAARCLDWLRAELGERGRFQCWMLRAGLPTASKRSLIAEHAALYAASSRGRHPAALQLLDELLGRRTGDLDSLIPVHGRAVAELV